MTKIRQDAIELLKQIPEDKVIYMIQIMQGMKGLYSDDVKQREEALERLEHMRKKAPELDYDAELSEYREERYGNAGIG